jgi:hypothetical protein
MQRSLGQPLQFPQVIYKVVTELEVSRHMLNLSHTSPQLSER